mgnify:CR=1 FL=1
MDNGLSLGRVFTNTPINGVLILIVMDNGLSPESDYNKGHGEVS